VRQKIADLLNTLYGFRNVIVWLLLFGISVLFRLKSYIDGPGWVDLCKNTFLGLVAVHGSEHLISVVQEYYNAAKGTAAKPQEAAPPSDNLVEGDGK